MTELQANGAMQPDGHPRIRGDGRTAEFLLVPTSERDAPREDINKTQFAQAAIRAGVEALLDEAGLEAEQVERVAAAGAFGTYLDVDSALAIGMFPPPCRASGSCKWATRLGWGPSWPCFRAAAVSRRKRSPAA